MSQVKTGVDSFLSFARPVKERYEELSKNELFTTDIPDLAQIYLDSFPEGANPLFRTRNEYDCSCCKHFIRRLGSLVAIVDGNPVSMWPTEGLPYPFDVVSSRLNDAVCNAKITGIFRTNERSFGQDHSYDKKDNRRYNHFFGEVRAIHRCVDFGTAIGAANSNVQVFRRGLVELKPEAISEVISLIESNSLYRGAEFKKAVAEFWDLQKAYQNAANKEAFVWSNYKKPSALVRNTAIGTLLIDLSDGMDLEQAVRSFESKVAPTNYRRPSALITPRMIEQAVETIKSLDLELALERRYARIEDVSVNNVLFVDNSVKHMMKDSLTSKLMETVKAPKVEVKNPATVTIDEFISAILPQCSSIDLLVSNTLTGNFMSLTAPVHENVKRLFKWDNNFAWSYDGEIADSIKQRVKSAGGNINALLRVSLAWYNYDDLDIHAIQPRGPEIYYGNKQGILDVDMNAGRGTTRNAVENLAFNRLTNGDYFIEVHNFSKRESIDVGFEIEVECGGEINRYVHKDAVRDKSHVKALAIRVQNNKVIGIVPGPGMVGGSLSQDKWGVKTETLVPVSSIMLSPNYWDGQQIGNKHWFFILQNCKAPGQTRGIYNEFLRSDLEQHRKVFEVLGAKTKCPESDKQLSGLGFSSTKKEEVVVVAKGNAINRALKIVF